MAFPKDTFVQVTSVTDTDINIQVGPNGYSVQKSELQELMSGAVDDFETIKRNLAVALTLAGVNLSDDIAVKQVIESRTFKAFR